MGVCGFISGESWIWVGDTNHQVPTPRLARQQVAEMIVVENLEAAVNDTHVEHCIGAPCAGVRKSLGR
jgi:hypothetical protein